MEHTEHQWAILMIEIFPCHHPFANRRGCQSQLDLPFASTVSHRLDYRSKSKAFALQSCSMTCLWRWTVNRCPTKKRNGTSDECLVISGHLSCLYGAGRDQGILVWIYTVVSVMESSQWSVSRHEKFSMWQNSLERFSELLERSGARSGREDNDKEVEGRNSYGLDSNDEGSVYITSSTKIGKKFMLDITSRAYNYKYTRSTIPSYTWWWISESHIKKRCLNGTHLPRPMWLKLKVNVSSSCRHASHQTGQIDYSLMAQVAIISTRYAEWVFLSICPERKLTFLLVWLGSHELHNYDVYFVIWANVASLHFVVD